MISNAIAIVVILCIYKMIVMMMNQTVKGKGRGVSLQNIYDNFVKY